MSETVSESETYYEDTKTAAGLLLGGDLLVLLSFVVIGRRSHALDNSDFMAIIATVLPFAVTWFIAALLFGLYKEKIYTTWQRLLPRLLLTWGVAVPLAHLLRALLEGQPVMGIPLIFVLVSLGYIGLVMTGWRLGYIWWQHRKQQRLQDNPGG